MRSNVSFFSYRTYLKNTSLDPFRVSTPSILSSTEYRKFWVAWDDDHLTFGRGMEVGSDVIQSMATWEDTSDMHYLSMSGFYSVEVFAVFLNVA